MAVGTNHILQILQEPRVVFGLPFRFHRGDLLHLSLQTRVLTWRSTSSRATPVAHLQDEKAVVLEVDPLGCQQLLDVCARTLLAVHEIFRCVVAVGSPRHHHFRTRHSRRLLALGLGSMQSVAHARAGRQRNGEAYPIDNLGKMHVNFSEVVVAVLVRFVNELGHLQTAPG